MKKIFIIGSLLLAGCITNKPDIVLSQTDVVNIQRQNIEVFFTPGLDCENAIIKRINNANTIDIAVYSITNPNITDAIIAANKRGANIRVITDKNQSKVKGSKVEQIKEAGIPLVTNKKHKIEHNKFAIFDGVHMVSGSYNWTTNASKNNSENCVFFDQPNKEYSARFEYLWNLYNQTDAK